MLLWRRIVTTNSHFKMSRFRAIGVEERKPEHFMELLELNQHAQYAAEFFEIYGILIVYLEARW